MVVVVVVGARCDAFSTHQRQRAKSDKRERKMIKMLEEQEEEEEEENDRPSIDGVAGRPQSSDRHGRQPQPLANSSKLGGTPSVNPIESRGNRNKTRYSRAVNLYLNVPTRQPIKNLTIGRT